jgi:cyclopropane fatty-acyl-phospholipid synthase-like methyltransferase
MVRYHLAALTLKALSSTGPTRRLYRGVLGNVIGARRRAHGLDPVYFEKAKLLIRLAREHGGLRDGMRLLELGTGWMHFYAIVLRLLYDVRITLVDVWDNRQLEALRNMLRALDRGLEDGLGLGAAEARRARGVLAGVANAGSYEEIYRALGFDYRVDATGVHAALPSAGFDLVFSFDVLEHVDRELVPELLANIARWLVPGGVQIHHIGINDHLSAYDRSMSPKNYIRYSEGTWRRFFENDLQYVNRLQRPEWLERFAASGARLLWERLLVCDITGIEPSPHFARFSPRDLAGIDLTVALRNEGRGDPGAPPVR